MNDKRKKKYLDNICYKALGENAFHSLPCAAIHQRRKNKLWLSCATVFVRECLQTVFTFIK